MSGIGIFLCTCDQKIDKSVDVAAVESAFSAPGVRVLRSAHACLPDGLRDLQAAVRTEGFERVVVAACPARFQSARLSAACAEAGVPPEYFALVDWREGCAWPHRGDKDGATAKAVDLLDMGLGQVSGARREAPTGAVQAGTAESVQRVLIIGGGVAGTAAACALVESGIPAALVERRGNPEWATAPCDRAPSLDVHLGTQVAAISGRPGAYRAVLRDTAGGTLFELEAGAIIVATGAQEYRPAGRFRYDGRRVLTLGDFQAVLDEPARGAAVDGPVVYWLCAGARDEKIPYCSKTCCVNALQQALRVKREHPDVPVTIVFRDLYLLGDELKQDLVREARRLGIAFARYTPDRPPRADEEALSLYDHLSGALRRYPYRRLVLATPRVPREDAGQLAHALGLPRDENGFFAEPHRRVRPERQVERGIFVAGSAHQPVDAGTAEMQGRTAAARAARFLQRGAPAHPAAAARVDERLCTGCAQCVAACEFGAARLGPPAASGLAISAIDPFLCTACGSCAVACPTKAIDLPGSSDRQIFAQIDASLRGGAGRILVFGCTWSGFASMQLAGARRSQYPASVRAIELPCSARLDPLHVLYAFMNGAQGVMLALCAPDECHYENGNRTAAQRVEQLRAQLAAHGIDPRRLSLVYTHGDDALGWVDAVAGFEALLEQRLEKSMAKGGEWRQRD